MIQLPDFSRASQPVGAGLISDLLRIVGSIGGGIPYLVRDDFTDADGTLLTAHIIAPINTVGATWAGPALAGDNNLTIRNNRLQFAGVSNAGSNYLDAGIANAILRADYFVGGPGGAGVNEYGAFVSRWTGSTAAWLVLVGYLGSPVAQIYQYNSSLVLRASAPYALVQGTTYALALTLSGNSISLAINGAGIVSYSSSFNAASTRHGLRLFIGSSASDNTYLDNFSVEPL